MRNPLRALTLALLALLAFAACGSMPAAPAASSAAATNPDTAVAQPDVATGIPVQIAGYPAGVTPDAAGGEPQDDGVVVAASRQDWLSVKGNRIVDAAGNAWMGRGVTIHDTRACDFCTSRTPNVALVKKMIDEAVDNWHVNFIRLLLLSFPSAAYTDGSGGARVQWDTLLHDPNYLHDIQEIVRYIGTKPHVYVMVSLWQDPSFSSEAAGTQGGLPTAATYDELQVLARAFVHDAHVIFAASNEPEQYNASLQDACVASMNGAVQAIRAVEDGASTPHHLVAVQGTMGWARLINYYEDHPVMGDNVIYETHAYTSYKNLPGNLQEPAKVLPVIIGEFAPAKIADTTMVDVNALLRMAEALQIPYTAWDFHTNCNNENMLFESASSCSYHSPLKMTSWGKALHAFITSKQ